MLHSYLPQISQPEQLNAKIHRSLGAPLVLAANVDTISVLWAEYQPQGYGHLFLEIIKPDNPSSGLIRLKQSPAIRGHQGKQSCCHAVSWVPVVEYPICELAVLHSPPAFWHCWQYLPGVTQIETTLWASLHQMQFNWFFYDGAAHHKIESRGKGPF